MFCCKSKLLKMYWGRLQLSIKVPNIDIWSLVTAEIDQIGKQTVTISVFLGSKVFVCYWKCSVVNEKNWTFIEEDSSFYLTYQTLISDHWWQQKLIKSQKSRLFVYQFKQFLQSPVIRYQCLICQMKAGVFFNEFSIILINNITYFSNKWRLQSPKVRNCDCLFTNLINFCSHQWSDIHVW